jgi:betaine-aldehyde dehydrogenase
MQLAALEIKRVTLELGGKSANIVFADADREKALDGAMWSVLGNAGQDCCARSRLLVESSLYDSFVSDLAAKFRKVRFGDPLNDNTEMGPLISAEHRQRICDYITLGKEEGAILEAGGEIATGKSYDRGNYLQPTLFGMVHNNMRIATEEIFGPVLCAMPFEDEEEAISIANASSYGLSGSVWTRNITRALRLAKAVETGVISINSSNSVHLEAPFGGFKKSGLGRELGLPVLDHYSELKTVFIDTQTL